MINKKLIITFIFFIISLQGVSSSENDIYKKIDLFGEVLEKINKEYVDEINQSESMDSAINGLLQSLDPYSAYMSPEVFNEMQTETSGEFGGLGIEVSMESGVVKVISPIDDTPASRAGIKAGDYIVKINDIQVQGKSLSEAVDLMRGPVGSGIELTIRRRGNKKALIFNVVREVIQIQSVKADLLEKNIGYIRLTSFNENSGKQIEQEIKKLEKNEAVKSYILDLRNNPGGLLSQAIKISDFFLDNGEIVSTKSRKASENRKWFAKNGDLTNGKTLVVLINYGSASASEIVAGALKDHKRAILVGENSFGKGSVQSIIPLKNDGAIRLTIAKYYLPSGKSISEVGVSPDIEIDEEGENFRVKTETDNQLNYAIKLLNG
jgi:carboxyl-terminal processing protease|tara:strand:+ start:315 stop:1451 length:1137 start_codon:yes stop_codon:yes gene_type:complete